MILFCDRCIQKLKKMYREALFRKITGNEAKGLRIRGEIYIRNKNISCGNDVAIYPGVQFFGDGPIKLGNNVQIGNNTLIYASKDAGVTIGNDVSIAAHSYVIDTDHGIHKNELIRKQACTVKPIVIENDVWIASNVTVLKGSVIHEGAVIGAKSLVLGEIDAYGIAVGIPAKVIKHRE